MVSKLVKEASKLFAEKVLGEWIESSSSRKLEQLWEEMSNILAQYEWFEVCE